MNDLSALLDTMDWWGLLGVLITAASALLCITVHELCHGLAAYRLGDPTAKILGRLTLNPIKHIDPMGLVLMLVAHVGWAKPVPVNMRNFKDPRRGMALTALAGPASNFVLAFAALALSSLIYYVSPLAVSIGGVVGRRTCLILLCVLANIAILSVGLGLFNLIPISPLDGSKVLFSFLPARIYNTILRYERYVMLLVIVLTLAGVFYGPLGWLIQGALRGLCVVTGYPIDLLWGTQDISFLSHFL